MTQWLKAEGRQSWKGNGPKRAASLSRRLDLSGPTSASRPNASGIAGLTVGCAAFNFNPYILDLWIGTKNSATRYEGEYRRAGVGRAQRSEQQLRWDRLPGRPGSGVARSGQPPQ